MCGIIGYIGPKDPVEVIMEGLSRLEYRGYDSAGLAVIDQGGFVVRRATGKLEGLRQRLALEPVHGTIGMGHTRWATHGRPCEANAHPHLAGDVAVVHNGIIENYLELKRELQAEGRQFSSDTDTEIVAHLVQRELDHGAVDLPQAVSRALGQIRGSYALVILDRRRPDLMIGARKDSPLILGLGQQPGEFFLASDVPAFLSHSNQVVFLDDGDLVTISHGGYQIESLLGPAKEHAVTTISWSPAMAEKAGFKHFMQKEIFEQPRALTDTLTGRVKAGSEEIFLPDLGLSEGDLRQAKRMVLLACGTSYHAALVAKFAIEGLARMPAEVDLGSEFRYRDPLVGPGDIVVAISQSGETADTLAAVREARAKGARAVGVCNVLGSTLTRETDGVVYTHAGPEIGVASTKAFTTQLMALYILAIHLGRTRGVLDAGATRRLVDQLVLLPGLVQQTLEREEEVRKVAEAYCQASDFLYLGRGNCFPIALEGALKLKEISYIHAEGYPAGEMKHGPIALIDEKMPVVVLANQTDVLEKVLSNMEEVRARGGKLIAVTEEDNRSAQALADAIITVPNTPPLLAPVTMVTPLQLLAYHVAVLRGTDVDQPRNLAKSVTVE
ncbi:glucosamine/fructose-6-phosphate aminotransferase, isomerizing [Desulfarculus baarsii DSM 2075]|uniref:Glutamine--fructose-6-phosphate aminotransferase [isomerizing] n=1 Tax=Desulfarculus baarsii (strain ATCC 33931 / DSM 2075 / LMG 7858 / VKM B-1802 / 2st14) TaxID=644282 RepID=E1QGF6_DESB2|nr:glutamine--fructose-6-phosphate transaminase (isomerizing) [Desulfarculus baarsii]ADK83668.1 glucosamine/fructose-6-phosphate aminotransferase, isomerizing [Desulfarculus baarsii DSM 2075]